MQKLMKNLLALGALGTLLLLGSLGCETGDSEDENFLDEGQTQSSDDDMEPLATGTCSDSSSFIDAQGYSCSDWVGYDCTRASEQYGYTTTQETQILQNCKKSCNQCSTDLCPSDPNKTQPGQCGCGTPDTDSDSDGTANCKDGCPSDPKKTAAGQCGCGLAEGTCSTTCVDNTSFVDAQGYKCSGWVGYDCTRAAEQYGYTAAQETQILQNCKKTCNQCAPVDQCPTDPNKTEPGLCGCGVPEGTCSGSAYNVYYGMLHSHTSISDGSGSPSTAYKYARDTAKLDFFSVADHDYYPDNMTSSDWTTIKNAANSYNADGSFVAFWGFEWTSDTSEYQTNGLGLGHVTIINSDDFCISSSTRTMSQLATWLSTRDVVAFFNHPGQYGTTFDKFNSGVTDKIVGMELWNRGDGFSSYYYNDGYYRNDGNLGYFDEAIQRGFYLGASGSDDNHSGSWGTTNGYRLAVLAAAKTRSSIYSALKARRFYSTLDKNLVLSFTANGAEMGSKISSGSLDIQVKASDKDNESFSRIRLLKKGSLLKEWTPNSTNPTVSTTISGAAGDYFYVIVRQSDGNEAISSPIFIK